MICDFLKTIIAIGKFNKTIVLEKISILRDAGRITQEQYEEISGMLNQK